MRFGITICHEGFRYPETARWAARRGAQVVFHPHYDEAEPGAFRPTEFADPRNSCHHKSEPMGEAVWQALQSALSAHAGDLAVRIAGPSDTEALSGLFVAAEARRKGLARALVGAAAELARRTEASALALSTAETNQPAHALYESLGFVRDNVFRQYRVSLHRVRT